MKYRCKKCGRIFDSSNTAIYARMRCICGVKKFELYHGEIMADIPPVGGWGDNLGIRRTPNIGRTGV